MRTLDTPCLEYQGPRHRDGYGYPVLDGEKQLLHRWIVEVVDGVPLNPGEVVRHRCDNPPCFRYDHLVRGTYGENLKDAWDRGLRNANPARGEDCPTSKLTWKDVRDIRRRFRSKGSGEGGRRGGGLGTSGELMREYGVTRKTIYDIVDGKTWKEEHR